MQKISPRLAATLVVLLNLALATTAPVAADRLATEKRGISSAAGAFELGNLDSISLFNGNLTVTVPIGGDYPVGPSLSYRLLAVYNSNGWERDFCGDGTSRDIPVPDETDNAGFGWSVHLGRLRRDEPNQGDWTYVSPDGSQHRLYSRLHPGQPAAVDPNVFYSNDSTYLRMIRYPSGNAACNKPAIATSDCFLMQFPDGATHEFHRYPNDPEDIRLTRMRDSFDNFVDVNYPADGTSWEITDQHGRTQQVHFAGPAGDYDRVSRVELTAFGAATATYNFSYARTSIRRQGISMVSCPAVGDSLFVQLLNRIELPDGSSYDMAYNTTDAAPEYLSGGINSLRVPTGGELSWKYTPISFPSQEPEGGGDIQNPPQRPLSTVAYGVAQKDLALSAGGPSIGTWTYQYGKSAHTAPGDNFLKCHSVTTVTDPLGNTTRSYFSTSKDSHAWSYGLPFTRCDPSVGYAASGPFLSQEIFQGSSALLRRVYVEYGSDGPQAGNGLDNQDKNHRLTVRRTEYHDDLDTAGAPRFKETRFEGFDGLGNFRRKIESGNLSAQDDRITQVDYNGANGTWVANPENSNTTGSTFVMPARSAAWLWGTFTTQSVTIEPGMPGEDTATVQSCFDARGFLAARRVLAGLSPSQTDQLMVFEEVGTTGQIATDKLYGGDANPLTFDNTYPSLCAMTLPIGNPAYQTEHTYAYGVRSTSATVDPCDGSEILRTFDADIDRRTGLIATSRDVSEIPTDFDYDSRGRLINEKPLEDAWTSYAYLLPTPANPNAEPYVSVRECENGSATCNPENSLSWSRLKFDGLGRTKEESIQIPTVAGVATKSRSFTYNALGWKLSATMWDSSRRTNFTNHDPFGRPGRVTMPDGNFINFTYLGDRIKTRDVDIELAAGPDRVFTTELFDAQGRLVGVCEDRRSAWQSGCPGGLLTSYGYDVGSRLSRVCSKDNGTACGQTRLFTYDHRGFKIRETLPELNNLATVFTRDAQGNVLTRDAPGTQFDLQHRYDAAGRLIEILELNGPSPSRSLKQFFYGYSNLGGDLRKGKIVQARRHNWVDIVRPLSRSNPGEYDAIVSERFVYTGRSGRVGTRQTRYSFGGTTFAFQTGFTWDEQGNIADLAYPRCLHSQGGCQTAAPDRTISHSYEKGFLTAIPGYAPNIDYQAGGMLHQIQHANGVIYTMQIDDSGMQRPKSISTTAGWNTGTYSYDGAGNITSIGTQAFSYDGRSQLLSGQVLDGGTLRTQTATYDSYGNITNLTTDGSTVNLPVLSTNRLGSPFVHDAAGNLTHFQLGGDVAEYTFDALNMMKHLQTNSDLSRIFLYTASDERLATFECPSDVCQANGSSETWTLRDLDGKVVRSWEHPWGGGWQWKEDHVFRNSQPLVRINSESIAHLHLDHIQTPRQITSEPGSQQLFANYYSYGKAVDSTIDLTFKFTGHERDQGGGAPEALDYMHARFYSANIGRFLSVDPALDRVNLMTPVAWNIFLYAQNRPGLFVDPDGRIGSFYSRFISATNGAIGGIANAIGSNLLLGAARRNPPNAAFARGQAIGDAISLAVGAIEAVSGAAAVAGGTACAAGTLGGCAPVAAGPVAVGAAAVGHGALVVSKAGQSLMSGQGRSRTAHGEQRLRQAKQGDPNRNVGDANRVIDDGREFSDSASGHRVFVKGDKVVITNSDGQIVTQFRNSHRNTQQRIQDGVWVPVPAQ